VKNIDTKSVDKSELVGDNRNVTDQKTFAVKKILKNEPVKHKLGPNGDYEVCTVIEVNRRTWRASCQVLYDGAEIEEFSPLYTDFSNQIRRQREIPEELQTRFVKKAVDIHFDRCNAVENFIASQNQSSCLRPKLKIATLLIVSFLLLVPAGYWIISTDIRSPFSEPDTTECETYFYKCKPAEPCNFALAQRSHWSETSKLKTEIIQTNIFPKWLTFDPNLLCFRGQVPPDEPNQSYHFQIRITDHGANERLVQVNLKIDGYSKPPSGLSTGDTSIEKSVDSKKIDDGYLLEQLLDK
jgi:hypothetical protein